MPLREPPPAMLTAKPVMMAIRRSHPLPPGMAYGGGAADDASADHPDQHAGSARIGDDDAPADNDSASTDLPAFLTEDEPRRVLARVVPADDGPRSKAMAQI